jgi:hypothetical protein
LVIASQFWRFRSTPPRAKSLARAPAVYRQLVAWANELGVGPRSGATDSPALDTGPVRPARGIKVVAILTFLTSLVWLLAGFAVAVAYPDMSAVARGVAGVIIFGLGVVGLVVGWGLWRRRGLARMAAMAYYAVSVLQALASVATDGLEGIVSAGGMIPVLIVFFVFFYLTRPHVAAAFRRPPEPVDNDDGAEPSA